MNLIWALKLLRSSPPEDRTLSARDSPLDISPLSDVQRNGLIAISVLAVISAVATFSLLCFISYRLIFWRRYYQHSLGFNQNIVLIYNLLVADFIQALAFLICTHWVVHNAIRANTAACFLQGLLLQIGDPGSGLFVLAIALHTFMMVTSGRKLEHRWFVTAVVGVWAFLAILVIIPLASHGADIFIPSGAWCWINEAYETDRLWTHYLWIFLAEFGTVVLYAIMFVHLRRRIAASTILGSSHADSLKRLRRVVSYMVIYPVAYVVLSLPLAAGRMASERGTGPSMAYFCLSGAMMTSSGFVDVIMYTLTRKNLLIESELSRDRDRDRSYNHTHSNSLHSRRPNHLTTTTITARDNSTPIKESSRKKGNPLRSVWAGDNNNNEFDPERDSSTELIVPNKDVELTQMGKVYQSTTIEITHEPADMAESVDSRSSRDLPDGHRDRHNPSNADRMWGK
ncbi:hypothetical protein VTN77DRAFT_8063 [Rasamsonia byssochlamydoides]|uniref:uncharacterized protein n=1 Tax=Rasamsonia byssochlamydoides TaxID=89139 RepID=UPI00374269EC